MTSSVKTHSVYLTFLAITLFYFFESIQFAYFNVLAPSFLKQGIYTHQQIAALSAGTLWGILAKFKERAW